MVVSHSAVSLIGRAYISTSTRLVHFIFVCSTNQCSITNIVNWWDQKQWVEKAAQFSWFTGKCCQRLLSSDVRYQCRYFISLPSQARPLILGINLVIYICKHTYIAFCCAHLMHTWCPLELDVRESKSRCPFNAPVWCPAGSMDAFLKSIFQFAETKSLESKFLKHLRSDTILV